MIIKYEKFKTNNIMPTIKPKNYSISIHKSIRSLVNIQPIYHSHILSENTLHLWTSHEMTSLSFTSSDNFFFEI